MTQNELVLNYMAKHGAITQRLASEQLGVSRLAARIDDLKEAGIKIKTELIHVPTRWGKKARVAKYTLENPVDKPSPQV